MVELWIIVPLTYGNLRFPTFNRMKRFLKSLFAFFLALLSKVVIRKYRPRIVMVTGSVGKTSTKDAVAAVLASRFLVRKSEKSFNSEFGVPFTIFGVANPWGNPIAWLSLVKNALALILLPNHYPNMLVLEVGADQPGDLARILRIAQPDAVVVTRLPDIPVHVEAYASPEEVREEEFSPAYALPAGAPLIISSDDAFALSMAARSSANVSTYGLASDADVRIMQYGFHDGEQAVTGMRAELLIDGKREEVHVLGSVGKTQVLPAVAAIAIGRAHGIDPAEAIGALATYEPPAGRGRLLEGKNTTVLIDDTYNASPAAAEEALETLKNFPHAKRRIVILGDMLELGRYSVSEHERIGTLAADAADVVISVGIRARAYAEAARAAGVPAARTLSFDDSRTAASALAGKFEAGDVILVKGSQSIRMERVVEALLAHPSDANRLVRQEPQWKRR